MQRNFIKKCKVCGAKDNVCFHYGVCTCRACGAFFRRYLENEKKSKYSKCKCLPNQLLLEESKEEKSGTHWDKCKKCRLDKCFSVGMKKLGLSKYLKIIWKNNIRCCICTSRCMPGSYGRTKK
uniref:Nuclear receptor domain-containing protein n=1 Tax=Meloidogyne incognita TaxID=6306 RepID=A0A914LU28_MELIC